MSLDDLISCTFLSGRERELNAARREYELHQTQYERNQNRLEAFLSRHWPEVLLMLALDSVTLESLLIAYGDRHRKLPPMLKKRPFK